MLSFYKQRKSPAKKKGDSGGWSVMAEKMEKVEKARRNVGDKVGGRGLR